MFSVPPPGKRNDKKVEREGTSDVNPIVLEGYKSVDFERLIALIYPRFACATDVLCMILTAGVYSDDFLPGDPAPTYTKEEWTSILKLSTAWEMDKVGIYF